MSGRLGSNGGARIGGKVGCAFKTRRVTYGGGRAEAAVLRCEGDEMREDGGSVSVHSDGGAEDDDVAGEKGKQAADLAKVQVRQVGELGRWVGHQALRVL